MFFNHISGGAGRMRVSNPAVSMPTVKQAQTKQSGAPAVSFAEKMNLTNRNRDTVQISCRNIETARQEGYIEVNGARFAISEQTVTATPSAAT